MDEGGIDPPGAKAIDQLGSVALDESDRDTWEARPLVLDDTRDYRVERGRTGETDADH